MSSTGMTDRTTEASQRSKAGMAGVLQLLG
jgi:hypothetical protein